MMNETTKGLIKEICERFNLQVLGSYSQSENLALVVFKHRENGMVVPFYLDNNGEIFTKEQSDFYEVTTQEIGDWFS